MIASHARSKRNDAGRQFEEWASFFAGEIFVKLVVYADESGTNDPIGKRQDSRVAVVAGYMARCDEWPLFCNAWREVLGTPKYAVSYFHYRELANNKNKTSIYYGWNTDKILNFLYDLAEIAGRYIPVGGFYNLEAHAEINKGDKRYPYSFVFEKFFEDLFAAINEHYPNLKGDVDLFFDQKKGDTNWQASLFEMARDYREHKDNRLGALTFADKKKYPHWPLQAADLYAYRMRKRSNEGLITIRDESGNIIGANKKLVNLKEALDYILLRNTHPFGFFPILTPELLQDSVEAVKYPSAMRAITERAK